MDARPLTPAQRAYLALFEDWLHNPTDANARRRQNGLEVLLLEADVEPVNRPDTTAAIERLRRDLGLERHEEVDELVALDAIVSTTAET